MSNRSQPSHHNAQGAPGRSRVVPTTFGDPVQGATASSSEEPKSMQRLHADTVAALNDAPHDLLDPALHHPAGTSKAMSSSPTGRGPLQTTIFDGLLPRIETRGQSKRPSRKASEKRSEHEQSPSQQQQQSPPNPQPDHSKEESNTSMK